MASSIVSQVKLLDFHLDSFPWNTSYPPRRSPSEFAPGIAFPDKSLCYLSWIKPGVKVSNGVFPWQPMTCWILLFLYSSRSNCKDYSCSPFQRLGVVKSKRRALTQNVLRPLYNTGDSQAADPINDDHQQFRFGVNRKGLKNLLWNHSLSWNSYLNKEHTVIPVKTCLPQAGGNPESFWPWYGFIEMISGFLLEFIPM